MRGGKLFAEQLNKQKKLLRCNKFNFLHEMKQPFINIGNVKKLHYRILLELSICKRVSCYTDISTSLDERS